MHEPSFFKMEPVDYKNVAAHTRIINQHGSGYDSDGYYVYTQGGEGIGSLLGSLFRGALPILGSAIKGMAKAAAPHFKKGVKRGVAAGAEKAIRAYTQPKKRRNKQPRTAKL